MRIVPYTFEHGMAIRQNVAEGIVLPPRHLQDMDGYSAIMDSGEVVCCAGLYQWQDLPHIATAWAFVNRNISGPALFAVTKAVIALLETRKERRIEALCREDWAPARRWLQRLGFEYEGPVRKYGPDGSDFARYARVQ